MTDTMRTVRFHQYGEPADVLRLERAVSLSPVSAEITEMKVSRRRERR